MSEFEPSHFLTSITPEAAEQLNAFNVERQDLYSWMGGLAAQMPDYAELQFETINRVHVVSGAFARSSLAVKDNISNPKMTGYLVSQSWIKDEEERVRMIKGIMPQIAVDEADTSYVKNVVEVALAQKSDDEVSNGLRLKYNESLIVDVRAFFISLLAYKQAMSQHGREVQVPAGLGQVRHFEVNDFYHRWMADYYGKVALRGLL